MGKRPLLAVVAGLALALIAYLALSESDDERAIRGTLEAMARAVERGDEGALARHVAADYTDPLGHDEELVVRRAIQEGQRYEDLRVVFSGVEIDVQDEDATARATFRVDFEGTRLDPPRATDPEGRRYRATFRRHGERWLLTRGDVVHGLSGLF